MFYSINPYTGEQLKKYQYHDAQHLKNAFVKSNTVFKDWRKVSLKERTKQIATIGNLLIQYKEKAATLITTEMGKPISQSIAEVEKCATLCDYYAKNGIKLLANKKEKAQGSYVTYEPLGTILGIMPWNFPFWQVMRFAIPTILAGNTVIVKHASNVPECALFLEAIFNASIELENVYQNIFCSNKTTENAIGNKYIKGVSLTGSTKAGLSVAQAAAKYLKPVILELGGSNALIIFEDADINYAIDQCVKARFLNNGQSCIAGKRLLVQQSIKQQVIEKLIQKVEQLKDGDPLDQNTEISVLAKREFVMILEQQLDQSIDQGALLLVGGKADEYHFSPTIVSNVTEKMPLFKQETFGPVLAITTFETEEEAIRLANATDYGLGVSLFSDNVEKMRKLVSEFDDAAVFINGMVKSIPQLPFGGTKMSGLGRELADEGLKAFTNCKTVVIENKDI